MALKIYVDRDSEGRSWPPDHTHENQGMMDILKRLWWTFHPDKALIVAMANLHRPPADLVVITQRGIGILELKHNYGRIERRGRYWYAGPKRVSAGSVNLGRDNPYEQVQDYAAELREMLFSSQQHQDWLPRGRSERESIKINTAVCFTHPDADFADLKKELRHQPPRTGWEIFTVLGVKDTPEWVFNLRFEAESRDPIVLSDDNILRMTTQLLGGTEWTEVYNLMPTGEPFGYLTLMEQGQRVQIFGLDRDESVIGRDLLCDVAIPERFSRAGRKHARIWRELGQVCIEDLDSTNGTYVNQLRLRGKKRLKDGDKITFGGNTPDEKVCLLEFSSAPPVKPDETEAATLGEQ